MSETNYHVIKLNAADLVHSFASKTNENKKVFLASLCAVDTALFVVFSSIIIFVDIHPWSGLISAKVSAAR